MAEKTVIKKFNSIDLFKFLMAICVVAIHTRPLVDISNPAIERIISAVINSAVPFFFLSSGYLLANKFKSLDDFESNIVIVRKYLLKIIKMYLFWSAIYLPLAIINYLKEGNGFIYSFISYFRSLVFVGEHYDSWMLWYLLSTIYALAFFLLLYKKNVSIYVIAAVGFLFTLIGIFFDYIDSLPSLPQYLEIIHKIFLFTFSQGRIFRGMFLIPCGILMRHKNIPLPVSIIVFALFFPLECFTSNHELVVFLLTINSVGLFGIITRINLPDSKIYPIMRKMSTTIYFIHMFVFVIFSYVVYKEEHFGLVSFAATSAICVILALLWTIIRPKIKQINR